jgi:hypothetical protein
VRTSPISSVTWTSSFFDKIHLTLVKVVNIRGTRCELRLLRFLVNRAPALEQLVLVTVGEEGGLGGEETKAIQMRVSAMRTASPKVRVTVCRPGEDDSRNADYMKLARPAVRGPHRVLSRRDENSR